MHREKRRGVWRQARLLLFVLGFSAGCREIGLNQMELQLRFTPEVLSFGSAYVDVSVTRQAVLLNATRTTLPLVWTRLPEGFSGDLPAFAPSGETQFPITFSARFAGKFSESLTVNAEGVQAQLALSAQGVAPPACQSTSSCSQSTFNPGTGACEETILPDGTQCDARSLCVEEATCVRGRCVGKVKSCNDDNLCTIDVCHPNTGCEFLPAPPCPGDGKCQNGVCDPKVGCQKESAPDGTLCGPTQTCDAADVCIAGQCVQRNPPDGYVCAKSSPCQSEGRCQGSTCVRPEAVALSPNWSLDSYLQMAQSGDPRELHDFVLEPTGTLSLMGFFTTPLLRANTSAVKEGETPARRCILWNERLICADYPYLGSGKVSAIDLATSRTLWTHDLPHERPDLAALSAPGRLFLARLAALGPDRLAAVFESYPTGTDSGTQCRRYFLSVLDAQGRLISAQRISDSFLDVCTHPHPYGVVADTRGNLFIAFSHSEIGVAPLVPQSPSLLMSFTREGILRWQRVENFTGGELASARGLLFPEKGETAFATSTGAPFSVGSLPAGVFGRVVVTQDRLIPSPREGDQTLRGFELDPQATSYATRWTHHEPEGFLSSQIRLATWKEKPSSKEETVALLFARRNSQTHLLALRARHGQEMWSCPLSYSQRSQPQMMEVALGVLAIMDGASTCGTCDPPFAGSYAAFHTFLLPGLGIASEPWVGTFGGAGHDHLEDAVLPPNLAQ